MIVEYRSGDLMLASESYIAHGCNCNGIMGSGVARLIRGKWPMAYSAYREAYELEGLRLGTVIDVKCGDKTVLNMMTQQNFGSQPHRYVSYDAIASCFEWANERAPGSVIAIPRIGAGLGGGDWNVVSSVINSCTPDISVVVYDL